MSHPCSIMHYHYYSHLPLDTVSTRYTFSRIFNCVSSTFGTNILTSLWRNIGLHDSVQSNFASIGRRIMNIMTLNIHCLTDIALRSQCHGILQFQCFTLLLANLCAWPTHLSKTIYTTVFDQYLYIFEWIVIY